MKFEWMPLALVLFVILAGAASAAEPTGRKYGNVPLTMIPDPFEFFFSPHHIREDSNLLVLHFDFFGIPWNEFGNGDPLPAAWVAEMDEIEILAETMQLPVFLAFTPLAGTRDRLGPRATGETSLLLDDGFGQRCEILSGRSDWESIRAAYKAYAEHVIDKFDPMWVALSIEVNMYQQLCPAAWTDLEALLNEVYDEQKLRRPDLPVFHTFQIDQLWEADDSESACFGYSHDCLEENLESITNLKTDLFAISSYPLVSFHNNGRRLPPEWFSVFADETGLDLVVAETGYQCCNVEFQHPTEPDQCFVALESSEADQLAWMEFVLDQADVFDMPFVVWWGNEDFMPLDMANSCHCEGENDWCTLLNLLTPEDSVLFRFFATMALREFDGTPRSILVPWSEAVDRERPKRRRPVRRIDSGKSTVDSER